MEALGEANAHSCAGICKRTTDVVFLKEYSSTVCAEQCINTVLLKAHCCPNVQNLRKKWSRGESNSRAETVNNTRLRK